MSSRPKFDLHRLREIGWKYWDPIGLRQFAVGPLTPKWPEDEYDSYLMKAAGDLWNGKSEQHVTNYLTEIETTTLGLADGVDSSGRAAKTAASLKLYLETLR